uniref:DDE Tnp4 domain-containing protein n=2 Tax=Caenorhabditis japonica TaxID=281687 RepID=A0A8R1E8W9_CAEJA
MMLIKKKKCVKLKNWNNESFKYFKNYCSTLQNDEDMIKKHFFVSEAVVNGVVGAIRQSSPSKKGRKPKLNPFEKCVVFLQFVTGGESFRRTSQRIGVAKTVISNTVGEVAKSVNENFKQIYLPESPEQWRSVEDSFGRRRLIRSLGCLDGKHIRIKAPPNSGSLFYNYKHYFSFVLLGLVDGDGRFLWIDIGTPGSSSDSCIFNASTLKSILEDDDNLPMNQYLDRRTVMPSFIIADGIFRLSKRVMKPYGGRSGLQADEILYNKNISNTRVRVEHAFGVLSNRFRILRKEIECEYKNAVDLVQSLCHLHNAMIQPNSSSYSFIVEEIDTYPYSDAKSQQQALKDFFNDN